MIPVPQYPLFSGTLSELGLRRADYFLDEDNDWALQTSELQRCWSAASEHSHVRALVVINPGNPTGQVSGHQHSVSLMLTTPNVNAFCTVMTSCGTRPASSNICESTTPVVGLGVM